MAEEKHIICKNCGSNAENNYCSQCGQKTHLHDETFRGLIYHFIGHYFHYDSKFWVSLKTLWFHPGRLTIAYWKQQRMRYLHPISLYLFVSALFFILNSYNDHGNQNAKDKISETRDFPTDIHVDSLNVSEDMVSDYIVKKTEIIERKYGSTTNFFKEKFPETIPKVFFFLIPVMGFLLKLFFTKRKELLFVHHSIFALHCHAFWFSVSAFFLFIHFFVNMSNALSTWIFFILMIGYLLISLKNVYQLNWLKSVFITAGLIISYLFLFAVILISDFLVLMALVKD